MKKKTISALVWLSLLLVMVCGGVAAGYYTFNERNPAKRVAKEQLEMVKTGQISRAYQVLMSDRYKYNNSLENFSEWIRNHPEMLSHRNAKFSLLPDGQVEAKLLSPGTPPATFVFGMVEEGKNWKVDSIRVESSEALSNYLNEKNNVLAAIQEVLMDLKHLNLKTAYGKLSPEFQELISYPEFTTIIDENDELTEFDFIRYGNYENEGDLRRIELNLLKEDENHFVTFWLNQDDHDWKVWAIEVKGPTAQGIYEVGELDTKPVVDHEPPSITNIIQDQLDLLKKGEIEKAYNEFAAEEFKKATTFEDFQKFIANYPEFSKYKSLRFGEQVENNGLYLQSVSLLSDEGESKVDFWVAKEGGQWKIWGIRIDESAFFPPISDEERNEIVQVIEDQLKKIQEGDLKVAYENYSAQEFKNNTPYDKFIEFVDEYPIFKQNSHITAGMGIQEGDLRLLRVALQSSDETKEIDYRLIKEEDAWKIWGIQIITHKTEIPENKEDVEKIVRDQLKEIVEKNYGKAYYRMTADEFQDAATFENFKKYIEKHSEFSSNAGIEIESVRFKPSFAEVIAKLTDTHGVAQKFVYRLVFEKDQWKILSIKMKVDYPPRSTPSTVNVSKAVIGTSTDLDGVVRNPKSTFSETDGEFTVNLYIVDGYPGDRVTVTLIHEDSASSIEPVTAELDQKGDSLLNFLFSPPPTGWPVGNYTLEIETSSGVRKAFTFKVE